MKATYVLLISLLMLAACKERVEAPFVENDGLIGKWKLTETFSDPGDGSGKWMKAKQTFVLEIRTDSTVKMTGEGSFLRSNSSYTLKRINQSRLWFESPESGSYSETNYIGYKVTPTDLELAYLCDEGCGERFKAIR